MLISAIAFFNWSLESVSALCESASVAVRSRSWIGLKPAGSLTIEPSLMRLTRRWVREAISRLEQRALASGRAHEPITIAVTKAGTVANMTLPINGNGTDKQSSASLALLRKTLIPQTVGALPNAGKYLEFSIEGPDYYPWQEGLFVEDPYAVRDGRVTIPSAPGLTACRCTRAPPDGSAAMIRYGEYDARETDDELHRASGLS